jgi:hypothetical protein
MLLEAVEMGPISPRALILALCITVPAVAPLAAQQADSAAIKEAKELKKALARAKASEPFYTAMAPLEIKLTTNIKRIRSDKGETAPWRPATLSYTDAAGKLVTIPTLIKTRGIWRLKNCEFPPLRLNFKGEQTKGTVLEGIDKPKLVSFCRNNDTFEEYITQEMQLYRIYGLLTPATHRARLLHLTYADSASGKITATRMAILLEEPEIVAARLGGVLVNIKGATPSDLLPSQDVLASVFQYFIGNTDWSTFALHNVELVRNPDGDHLPIPYDFDFSGVIGTNYATVDPSLKIETVKQRLYRGFCGYKPEEFSRVFALFNEKKDAIYALYSDSIGGRLSRHTREATLKYFDDFYSTINNPKKAKNDILDACVKVH